MFARRGLALFSLFIANTRTTAVRRPPHLIGYFVRMLSQAQNGDTRLHTAMYAQQPTEEIKRLIQEIGSDAVSLMARTVNDRGQLPFDLVCNDDSRSELSAAAEKVGLALLPLMTVDMPPISQPVATPLILQRYEAITRNNIQLGTALKMAGDLANEVRQIVTESGSHPQSNGRSYTEVLKTQLFLQRAHEDIIARIALKRTTVDLLTSTESDDFIRYTRFATQFVANTRMANCDQMSEVVMHQFAVSYFNAARKLGITCQLYNITNGGHTFVRIGDVICDAWSGAIFPFSEIEQRLKAWKHYILVDKWFNILVEFNPRYHQVQSQCTVTSATAELLSLNPVTLFSHPQQNDTQAANTPAITEPRTTWIQRLLRNTLS
ncbi:MAG TPA: hypothetical protein VJN02_11790 [Gammaproteobacteria bacterium]|nr:MAG: hypothetical protein A3E83_06940 [Gammaproteobacteria bacterium RIFCSPHIGHO2_12_FULL_41_20]HLB43503.1 hypothetical protein [Gammaproteobacteria bacterium]